MERVHFDNEVPHALPFGLPDGHVTREAVLHQQISELLLAVETAENIRLVGKFSPAVDASLWHLQSGTKYKSVKSHRVECRGLQGRALVP